MFTCEVLIRNHHSIETVPVREMSRKSETRCVRLEVAFGCEAWLFDVFLTSRLLQPVSPSSHCKDECVTDSVGFLPCHAVACSRRLTRKGYGVRLTQI